MGLVTLEAASSAPARAPPAPTHAGTVHLTLPDVPDGRWALVVKRDMLGKVRGAVRRSDGVTRAAVWYKVRVRLPQRLGAHMLHF